MSDPRIRLTVRSGGGTFSDMFATANALRKVRDAALRYFGLDLHGGVTYVLSTSDGRSLSLSEKIRDLPISDGDVLVLTPSQAIDG